jgi:hypothetical protein
MTHKSIGMMRWNARNEVSDQFWEQQAMPITA